VLVKDRLANIGIEPTSVPLRGPLAAHASVRYLENRVGRIRMTTYKLLLTLMVGTSFLASSCAIQNSIDKEPIDPETSEFTLTVPDVLDDEWTRWIIGQWGDFC